MTGSSKPIFDQQIADLRDVLNRIRESEFNAAAKLIAEAPAVHLTARGRNGLALRAFSNRLMQLGKPVAMLGDILSGPVGDNDVVVIASGSGRGSALLDVAGVARTLNAEILAMTGNPGSPLAQQATHTLTIPGSLGDGSAGMQPLGTLFEQSLGLVCDALVIDLMRRLGVTVDVMRSRHANIE